MAAFGESNGLRSLLRLTIGEAATVIIKLATNVALKMEKRDMV